MIDLDAERGRLLDFALACPHPLGGAAWLSTDGRPDPDRPIATWITARMVHVHALGAMLDRPGCADAALACLRGLVEPDGVLRGGRPGDGWVGEVGADGVASSGRAAYAHAFVVLAACTAVTAGLPGGRTLLDEAVATFERFWVEDDGLVLDGFLPADGPDGDPWARADGYRGLNAEMHSVEALLALHDLTGEAPWLDRATRGVRFAADLAAADDGRLPEHFDATWAPDRDLNADRPDDPFKPYGATIGHGFEWARLLLQVEGAHRRAGTAAPDWALPAAVALHDRASSDGWDVDGAPGFVYTTDWSGRPVVHDRMHWVVAEALSAAHVLHARTGEARYATDAERWWGYAEEHVLDRRAGSWHHQLDRANRPVQTVWPGKPDVYHAVTTTLVPLIPLGVGPAAGVEAGLSSST